MKHAIITTAGQIWKLLREKDRVGVDSLPRALKEKSVVVYQALGWLAREDKIEYHTTGGKATVSLTPNERR